MNKNIIKKLAKLTLYKNVLQQEVIEIIINNLSKAELKKYIFYVKQLIEQNTVYVKTADLLDDITKKRIETMFEGKNFVFSVDEEIGGGFKITDNDNTIDLTIRGMLEQTAIKLIQEIN